MRAKKRIMRAKSGGVSSRWENLKVLGIFFMIVFVIGYVLPSAYQSIFKPKRIIRERFSTCPPAGFVNDYPPPMPVPSGGISFRDVQDAVRIINSDRAFDAEMGLEAARNEAAWKAKEQEWQRQIDHNRVYPGMSYGDRKLAEENGLSPVCAGSSMYGGYGDSTLFRDSSGFYKVDGGFIQRYNDDGSLGPARRSK